MINDQQNHTAATCADVSPSTSAAAASKEILTLAEIKKFRASYMGGVDALCIVIVSL